MSRTARVALGVAVAVVVLGVWLLVGMTRTGFSTHTQPTAIEASVARTMRALAIPPELADATNPMPRTPEVLASARAHWADHCAICHGVDGLGETPIGANLYPKAPDMTLPATQNLSDGELFAIIENGIRLTGMPGWGDGTAGSGKGSWELVHFIRRLPELTPEEIVEIERLTPKAPAEWARIQAEEAFLAGEDVPPPPAGDHSH